MTLPSVTYIRLSGPGLIWDECLNVNYWHQNLSSCYCLFQVLTARGSRAQLILIDLKFWPLLETALSSLRYGLKEKKKGCAYNRE